MKRHYLVLFGIFFMNSFICGAGNQWNQRANYGGDALHRCTGFSIGNKGYIGGGRINSGTAVFHEDYWQYDPGSDSWTQIADFGGGKRFHANAFTIGNFAYVGLGEDDDDNYYNDFWRYVPGLNIWQPIAPYPGNPRRGASSFVIDNLGYVGTGQSDFGYEDDFYRYNPDMDQWFAVADFIGEARSAAVSFSFGTKGYLGTGHVFGDDIKDFYAYDSETDSWAQKADVGAYNRQDATGFVVNGKGYVGTGNNIEGNINYKDFLEYDFQNDVWTQANDFAGEGRRYMVSFVIDNIAFAGTGTDGTNMRDFWSFDPVLSTDEIILIQTDVFPNPSSSIVHITSNQRMNAIRIYNLAGQSVYQKMLNSTSITIEKEQIGAGSFVYVIVSDGGTITKGKMIFN